MKRVKEKKKNDEQLSPEMIMKIRDIRLVYIATEW